MQYRPEIDGLRAIAVSVVVLFHAGLAQLSGGYVGVDVFFVISGFLITRIIREDLEAGQFSVLTFYERRVRRIVPALVATVLFTSIGALLLFIPEHKADYALSVVSVATFSSNFYFWKTSGYFETAALLRPLLHTWSLAVEEQFYIVTPIVSAIVFRYMRSLWFWLFLLAAVASFVVSVVATTLSPTANFFLLPTRAWELLLGALLASAPRAKRNPIVNNVASVLGVLLIAYAVVRFSDFTPFPGVNALYPTFGAVLILHFACPHTTAVGALLSSRPFVAIGRISYSLYLVHWPVIVMWRYFTLRGPDVATTISIVLICLVLATLSYFLVEKPFRRHGPKVRAPNVVAWGAGALAGLALIGLTGWGAQMRASDSPTAVVTTAPANSWRNGVCFYEGEIPWSRWRPDQCVVNPAGEIPTLLWGDSYAAQYVPGLSSQAHNSPSRIYQYTAAGCPPDLGYYSYARVDCADFNANALALIDALEIRRVILAARWINLRSRGFDGLVDTVAQLQERGVEIIVIGQTPVFIADVDVIVARQRSVPSTLRWPDSIDAAELNRELEQKLRGVEFVDPTRSLCDPRGCLIRDRARNLWYDDGHFSDEGSEEAVQRYLLFQY